MYGRNVGDTLKTIAKVTLWLWVILGILMGYAVGALTATMTVGVQLAIPTDMTSMVIEKEPVATTTVKTVLFMIMGGGIGFLIGWISSVMLYAFGSLVSHSQQIDRRLETIQQQVNQLSEDLSYLCDVKENEIKKAIRARQTAGTDE